MSVVVDSTSEALYDSRMSFGKARIRVPETAAPGEIVKIRALIQHAMESGFRKGENGERVPRLIIKDFRCFFEGSLVFAAELGTGVAANPYFEFDVKIERSGQFRFVWTEDGNASVEAVANILVA